MNRHVALVEVRQDRGQVAGPRDDRAGGRADADAELAGDDLRQRRLAEPRRPVEQHVVEGLAAIGRGGDKDAQVLAHRALPHEVIELAGSEPAVEPVIGLRCACDDPGFAHCASSFRPARINASTEASSPSVRTAPETAPRASVGR